MNKQLRAVMVEQFEKLYDSNYYILGNNVKEFESEYAAYSNIAYCIGTGNGLDALILSLKALGIGKGDEVIVPSNTYIATVLAITHAGATPVLVEPAEATFNIDVNRIENAITQKTRAIIPVHLYGQACEMEQIMRVASTHKLFVVEDNAQSQGAKNGGLKTGSFGNANATSFYPAKNIGAFGDAGAITTNDKSLADKLYVLRNYGSRVKYFNEIIGYNSRLDEMQAAFLRIKLQYLDHWNELRCSVALAYDKLLHNVGDIILPSIAKGSTSVYHQYVLRTQWRDELQKALTQKGIGTLIHYPVPPHLQKAYAHLGYKKGDFPIAEKMAETCLSLPVYPGLKPEEIERIAGVIIEFYRNKHA